MVFGEKSLHLSSREASFSSLTIGDRSKIGENKRRSHTATFSVKGGVEMTDRTYNKWFWIETLSEDFKPLIFRLITQYASFYYT